MKNREEVRINLYDAPGSNLALEMSFINAYSGPTLAFIFKHLSSFIHSFIYSFIYSFIEFVFILPLMHMPFDGNSLMSRH